MSLELCWQVDVDMQPYPEPHPIIPLDHPSLPKLSNVTLKKVGRSGCEVGTKWYVVFKVGGTYRVELVVLYIYVSEGLLYTFCHVASECDSTEQDCHDIHIH